MLKRCCDVDSLEDLLFAEGSCSEDIANRSDDTSLNDQCRTAVPGYGGGDPRQVTTVVLCTTSKGRCKSVIYSLVTNLLHQARVELLRAVYRVIRTGSGKGSSGGGDQKGAGGGIGNGDDIVNAVSQSTSLRLLVAIQTNIMNHWVGNGSSSSKKKPTPAQASNGPNVSVPSEQKETSVETKEKPSTSTSPSSQLPSSSQPPQQPSSPRSQPSSSASPPSSPRSPRLPPPPSLPSPVVGILDDDNEAFLMYVIAVTELTWDSLKCVDDMLGGVSGGDVDDGTMKVVTRILEKSIGMCVWCMYVWCVVACMHGACCMCVW